MRCSADSTSYQAARGRFRTCMSVLERLGQTYWHAKFYHDFFQLAALTSRPEAPTLQRPVSATEAREKEQQQNEARRLSVPEGASPSSMPVSHVGDKPPDLTETNQPPYRDGEVMSSINEQFAPSMAAEIGDASAPEPWAAEDMVLVDSEDQIHLYHDWLDDDVLFQSLFPSA